MSDNKTGSNPQIDSTNIFEDFTSDTKLWEDVKSQEKKQSKDMFYYIKIFAELFKIVNLIAILGICLFFVYSFFQNKAELENYSFFSPVCSVFLWDVASDISGCYWLTAFNNKVETDLIAAKQNQFDKISPLFQHVYELENFSSWKAITFLLNKTESRLRPLEILSSFDWLKNKFESIDKLKVQCFDIVIKDDMTLDARCEAYSSDWDSDINTVWNDKQSGTSISVASSFIDFIDNAEESDFRVINKQKVFDYTSVSGNGIYTRKTEFELNLRYTNTTNLAL